VYDLHIHSTCSDGSTCPDRIASFAAAQGLRGFALTDHDTMRGVQAAQKAGEGCGVEVLAGAELSAYDPETGRRVHLLALFPKHPQALEPLFSRVAASREEACLRSLEVLRRRFPIEEADVRAFSRDSVTLFRAQILRALMERGYADRVFGPLYHELFSRDGGKAYFPVSYTPMEEAAETARAAGCCVILAHPGIYDSFDAAQRLAARGLLDGIETDYPRAKDVWRARTDAIAEAFSLLRTGGTDYHGFFASPAHPIGTCTTPDETVARLREIAKKR